MKRSFGTASRTARSRSSPVIVHPSHGPLRSDDLKLMGPPILDRDGRFLGVFSKSQMPRSNATYHRPPGLQGTAPMRGESDAWRCSWPALATLACALAPTPPASAAAASRVLVIEGAGEGHGVGMSQDGALGYARHGATYQQILAHYYTGTTIGLAPAKTIVKVLVGSKVKRVPLERYVRGVIGAEMSPELARRGPRGPGRGQPHLRPDLPRRAALASTSTRTRRSQVYSGVAAESAATNAAVAATAGQIVLYAGKPATTYFFASSGGMTESVQYGFPGAEAQPWLVGVIDPFEGTSSRWKARTAVRDRRPAPARPVQGRLPRASRC